MDYLWACLSYLYLDAEPEAGDGVLVDLTVDIQHREDKCWAGHYDTEEECSNLVIWSRIKYIVTNQVCTVVVDVVNQYNN